MSRPSASQQDDPSADRLGAPLPLVTPRRAGRLGDVVVSHLVDRIVSGEYPIDSGLPIEPELCAEFGVSRTVVRESIKLLEEKGMVKATPGRGTRVLPAPGWNLLDPVVLGAEIRHDLAILDDLSSVRAALECDMAAQCARVITTEQAAELTEQGRLLSRCVEDPARYLVEDVTFHEMIMKMSGNRLGHAIIHSIHAKARLSSRYNGSPTGTEFRESLAEHQRILEMILNGDADGAATEMRIHILGSWAKRRPAVMDAFGKQSGDQRGERAQPDSLGESATS